MIERLIFVMLYLLPALLQQHAFVDGFMIQYGNSHHHHAVVTHRQQQQSHSLMTSLSSSADDTNNNNEIGYKLIQKEYYDIVQVDLDDDRDYPIYIGTGYSDTEASELLLQHFQGNKVLIITNDLIAPLGYLEYYEKLLSSNGKKQVHTFVIPNGEEYKNMDILTTILDQCLEWQLDRKATLVALGGGVIGDMVGFAAAIYVRGISFVQIPTTVMSMVDSSVGGKTGVNHPLGKNMIGAFYQPQAVFIDTATLATLPDRELCSGISEIIKYGLIRDPEFLTWMEDNITLLLQRHPETWRYAITRSCQNKAAVVKADEKESSLNIRATLNLGHTFGHAIETGCGYGTYLHGEAVAIGIAMAAELSYQLGWMTQGDVTRITNLLQQSRLPIQLPPETPMTRDIFLNVMNVDKKVVNGKIHLILLKGVGTCVVTSDFDQNTMIQVIDQFIANAKATTTNSNSHFAAADIASNVIPNGEEAAKTSSVAK